MTTVAKAVDVDVPVRTAYDQWTRFEMFPHFMEGVERVDQLGQGRLHWVADLGLASREWDAEITDQVPDQLIAWQADGGVRHDGRVRFERRDEDRTRIEVELTCDPEDVADDAPAGVVARRLAGDLERFKVLVETCGSAAGAWRGEAGRPGQGRPPGAGRPT